MENDHLSREIAILRETVKVNFTQKLSRRRKQQTLDKNTFGVRVVFAKVACDVYEVASNDVKGHIKRAGADASECTLLKFISAIYEQHFFFKKNL